MILKAAQTWFANAITTPESRPDPVGAEEIDHALTPGPRSSARDRLEVYRRAYHARLVECLADDYPALRAAFGVEAFEALCRDYVAFHPSTGPNLNWFGQHMSEFCSSHPRLEPNAFAADLAALEWAIVEVIHAPNAAALTLGGLGVLPATAWADARLRTTPASRLLWHRHPVNAYFQAFRDGGNPAIPSAEASWTVVYRNGLTVWRMTLTEAMFDLLSALASGETLGAALAGAAASLSDVSEEQAGQRVTRWFREWVSSGLFSGVEVAG